MSVFLENGSMNIMAASRYGMGVSQIEQINNAIEEGNNVVFIDPRGELSSDEIEKTLEKYRDKN